ncbi:hypothetical protein [Neoroseomonas soli]|uniref:Uncharacterized protein n=1 Tax=Neoroseomonas soli TaxID=1081025 RepID=A0A9X9WXY7_9PROT|nr:hypothetical protein [Neoroseomonas soli]MBR0672016.1 hypothetical protein [Neoroseomonas soli]
MIPVPSPVAHVSIGLDPGTGTWRVEADVPRTLRTWRWGERRRLVAACSRGGRLDGNAFAAAVATTLYDPPPPPDLIALHALVALDLLGLGHGAAPSPLGAAEARLAARFGWLPSAIAEEPAPALDSLLANLDPDSPSAPGDGWSSIRVVEGPDG